ncbi:leucine-rich repeat-containing protein 58-like [Mucor ambiguus]|uniref:Leucine-rich repeat-containing protein 58-like n=1 Tax=Mucor ambiguus TaxID=91626 RepID=A0A0C9N1R0_9FUNG|nr:leucine-rich repeat-containing protein 58-like [Mucor ambiguus]
MGQTESKIKGSFTFAYLHHHSHIGTVAKTRKGDEDDYEYFDQDILLTHPELYGLRSQYPFSPLLQSPAAASLPSTSMTSLDSTVTITNRKFHERPDSGYMSPSYDESMQLANDLEYIDSTYYSSMTSEYCYSSTDDDTPYKYVGESTEASAHQGGRHVISFTDVMLSSPDKTLQEVYLPCRSIYKLSPNMAMLTMIRKLDLSSNYLTELPESIGYMQNLEALSVAKNRIKALPDTIGYLSNLSELDVSYNELEHVTPCIGYLEKLKTLSLAYNQITHLPTDVSGLVGLISLDLTRNPLRVLPAEISKLPFLRRMRLEECPFNSDMAYPLRHNAPSLVEICARTVIRKQIKIDQHPYLPQHMIEYIKSAKSCTSCHGPYYESYVLRGRLMEKTDVHIPLEYTLCSAHWSDADDRILGMFSAQPDTSSQVVHLPYRPMLPCPPKQAMERLTALTRRPRHASTSTAANPSANLLSESNVDTVILEDRDARLVPAPKFHQEHQLAKSSLARLTSKWKRTNLSW